MQLTVVLTNAHIQFHAAILSDDEQTAVIQRVQVASEQDAVLGRVAPLAPVTALQMGRFQSLRHVAAADNAPALTRAKDCQSESRLLRTNLDLREPGSSLLEVIGRWRFRWGLQLRLRDGG